MGDPLWPGEERAGDIFTPTAFLRAMVWVEQAWLEVLGVTDVTLEVPSVDLDTESGGNALIPLLAALRAAHPEVAERLHDGLTSQDVVDTAVMVMLRDAVNSAQAHLRHADSLLAALDREHGATPMAGRTLTQPAVPITFGHKLATWRHGLDDAREDLDPIVLPVQYGGPAGNRAGVEVAEGRARADALAGLLGLTTSPAWHTSRRPVTRIGDALVAATDACGRIARDVLELSRPEIGELSESRGGGSSSMPHKANPVLSVLVRRAALTTPHLAATLHLAAAEQVDERADGSWHAEWDTLRLLARRTVVALSQTCELLDGLQVHAEAMADNLAAHLGRLDAEETS